MKRHFLLATLMLLAFGLSCSQQSSSPVLGPDSSAEPQPMPTDVQDLVDVFGLPEDGSHEYSLIDPNLDPPDISDTSWDVYSVTLVWGQGRLSTVDHVRDIDWSGALSVNGVAWVLPVKTILFEPDEDYLLDQSSPVVSEWVSVTHGGYDGISFLVFLKRGIVYFAAPELTFKTEPFQQAWDFGNLVRLSAYYQMGEGAGVCIVAHKIRRVDCSRGSLKGQWMTNEVNDGSGHFEGVWFDAKEQPIGLYSGRFWRDDEGMGRFAGSVSGYVTDQVIAEFAGLWHSEDFAMCPICGDRFGVFKGRIKWLDREAEGEMWGFWGDRNEPTNLRGKSMIGRWQIRCWDHIASLVDP